MTMYVYLSVCLSVCLSPIAHMWSLYENYRTSQRENSGQCCANIENPVTKIRIFRLKMADGRHIGKHRFCP